MAHHSILAQLLEHYTCLHLILMELELRSIMNMCQLAPTYKSR